MADVTKSLWTRLMEGGSENLTNVEGTKNACPYDRNSCNKTLNKVGEGPPKNHPKSSNQKCYPGCPEPRRPLQPEEFCPEFGKPKVPPPPPCCFIRMQDPCAPCCCPPPKKCDDECRPMPQREPTCGCDLCKKKRCPDGKCCGPTEPSCQKAVRKCSSESQTSPELYFIPPEKKVEDCGRSKISCESPVPRCKNDELSIFEMIKRPLDWLLCTPVKIPVPHIEWHWIRGQETEGQKCNSSSSGCSWQRKCCQSPPWINGDYCPRLFQEDANRNEHLQEKSNCKCGHCCDRRLFKESCAKPEDSMNRKQCCCRPCRVRRILEKPIC